MTMSVTLPLKWHGGKHYLADWILEHRPDQYITYCEPYFGGGSVLFRHDPEGHSEVINDLNGELMNFWATLANPNHFILFQRLCEMTPFSEQLFRFTKTPVEENTDAFHKNIINAHSFFVRYRQSRQGLGTCFATMSKTRTRRGMNEQVAAWLGAIEGLPEIHERIRRVVLYNCDALKVIQTLDDPNTWFYLDPPYPLDTRQTEAYEFEMSHEDHTELLGLLATLKGKFSLSSYSSVLYDSVANDLGWRCEQREVPLHSSAKATKDIKTECLWMNY